jgi:DNA-binding PadR family transcriptional regulator
MADTLGEFEELVLLAALRLGDRAYGLSIAEEIEGIAGRPVARASVYVALRRLQRKGLISTKREPAAQAPRGKPRRFVLVKRQSLARLRHARRVRLHFWNQLEHVLGKP